MGDERLEFADGVEALFIRGLRHEMTPRLKERLRAEGLDLDGPLQPTYPAATFGRCVELAARELRPELPLDEALRWLGECAYEGWTQTRVGRERVESMRLFSPQRAFERFASKGWPDNTYTLLEYRDCGAACFEMAVSDVNGQPALYLGRFTASLRGLGMAEPRVEMRTEGDVTVYRFSWGA
jgi:uncharacterized protein (TIGR02265 family)